MDRGISSRSVPGWAGSHPHSAVGAAGADSFCTRGRADCRSFAQCPGVVAPGIADTDVARVARFERRAAYNADASSSRNADAHPNDIAVSAEGEPHRRTK